MKREDIDLSRERLLTIATSDSARTFLVMMAVTALVAVIVWQATLRLPFFLFLIYALAFLAGVAFIPLLSLTIGPSLGSFIPELLANMLWVTSMLGVRVGVLNQKETDEYVINRADRSLGPRSYWTRWAMAPFGISFEATEQAFQPVVAIEDRQAELENLEFPPSGETTIGLARGGRSTLWYVTKSDIAGILVPIGEKLSELREAGSPDIGVEAYAEALKKHGGDTSQYNNRTLLVGTFVFVLLGLGTGYVLFY